MILGNDGGATITFNGNHGRHNTISLPPNSTASSPITGSHITFTEGNKTIPTVAIPNRTSKQALRHRIGTRSPEESAFIAFDPDNPELVYGGSYQDN